MKRKTRRIILITVLLILISLTLSLILIKIHSDKYKQYSCNLNSDCVSQCTRGCVNNDWAGSNPDTSECFRAWNCSCVNNQCYTDGKPRS